MTMEMQRITFLKDLRIATFKEEAFNLDGAEGSAMDRPSTFSEAAMNEDQWTINYSSVGTTHYEELVMDGPLPGVIEPIRDENDSERCILAMDVPSPSETRTIALEIADSKLGVSDKVTFAQENGVYAEKKAQFIALGIEIVFENDYLFTVPVEGKFHTYVDINQDDLVAKLTYSDIKTFDIFRISLLALANMAG